MGSRYPMMVHYCLENYYHLGNYCFQENCYCFLDIHCYRRCCYCLDIHCCRRCCYCLGSHCCCCRCYLRDNHCCHRCYLRDIHCFQMARYYLGSHYCHYSIRILVGRPKLVVHIAMMAFEIRALVAVVSRNCPMVEEYSLNLLRLGLNRRIVRLDDFHQNHYSVELHIVVMVEMSREHPIVMILGSLIVMSRGSLIVILDLVGHM